MELEMLKLSKESCYPRDWHPYCLLKLPKHEVCSLVHNCLVILFINLGKCKVWYFYLLSSKEVSKMTRINLMQRFVSTGVSLDLTGGMDRNKADIKSLLENLGFLLSGETEHSWKMFRRKSSNICIPWLLFKIVFS